MEENCHLSPTDEMRVAFAAHATTGPARPQVQAHASLLLALNALVALNAFFQVAHNPFLHSMP